MARTRIGFVSGLELEVDEPIEEVEKRLLNPRRWASLTDRGAHLRVDGSAVTYLREVIDARTA